MLKGPLLLGWPIQGRRARHLRARRLVEQTVGVFGLVALVLTFASNAHAQAPTLSHMIPWSAAPGQTKDITFHGGNLAGATGLWTSFLAKVELATGIDQNGTKAD